MNTNTEKLRKKYMDYPPEGMTPEDIRHFGPTWPEVVNVSFLFDFRGWVI